MSSGSVRRVSREDIQLVQNLIERCLQLYMNQKEVVETLLEQAKIEPGFTELVWQKLEEENREFFNAYNLRLMVKQQIIEFNRLLEQQAQMMHRIHPSAVSSLPNSNGVHAPPMLQNPACYAPEQTSFTLKQEDVHHSMASNLANAFSNGSQNFHSSMHSTINMSDHASRIDASQSMLSTQSASVGLMQGMNGGMIKSEAEYSSRPSYMFGSEENVLETRPPIGNAPFPSFTAQSNRLPLNESILDPDTSTFGFLGLIPQSFSLSDLNSDFSQDILDSYARSPFLATEPDNFLDTGERDHHVDSRRLGTMSEALGYEEFGSE